MSQSFTHIHPLQAKEQFGIQQLSLHDTENDDPLNRDVQPGCSALMKMEQCLVMRRFDTSKLLTQ